MKIANTISRVFAAGCTELSCGDEPGRGLRVPRASFDLALEGFGGNGMFRREPVQQRQPVEAFAEAP